MRIRLAAASLAASALLVLVPATAAAKTSAKITIQTEADGFSGFVKSSARSCHSGRRVTLYRKVAGPDKKAGSDTAQPNQDGSQWKVSVSRDGSYYAVVSATRKCSAATSATKRARLSSDDGEAAAAADEPAISRLRISRGRPTGVANGILNAGGHPECVDGRKILVYRAHLNANRDIVREERIGYVIAKPKAPGASTYAKFTFKVSRNGYVSFKALATEACGEATSRHQYISRPERPVQGASAAQADGPAVTKMKIRQGSNADRNSVTGFLFSENDDCIAGRKVQFYRQHLSAAGRVLREERIGYSIAELADSDGTTRSKIFKFKLSRTGRVFARVLATDACQGRRSNVVRFTRAMG